MVADVEIIKQITIKEFAKFPDRQVICIPITHKRCAEITQNHVANYDKHATLLVA